MIKVVFFASLREAVGHSEMEISASSTNGLMTVLREQLSADALTALSAENIRIAVNQELIEGDVDLVQGDEVAFLPPVTGG